MSDQTPNNNQQNATTLENVVAQNADERQMAINKILASKEFILIGKDGIALVENIPAHDVLPILMHVYSYKLPQIIELMVVHTLNHSAKEFSEEVAAKAAETTTKTEEGKEA